MKISKYSIFPCITLSIALTNIHAACFESSESLKRRYTEITHNSESYCLITAVDMEDFAGVKEHLGRPNSAISKDIIHSAFDMSLAKENIKLIKLFLTSPVQPTQAHIDKKFFEYAIDGSLPDIIYLLQSNITPLTKAKLFQEKAPIMILPTSEHKILEIDEKLSTYALRMTSKRIDDQMHAKILSAAYINSALIDAANDNQPLIVAHILRNHSGIRPSEDAINTAFKRALFNNYFGIVSILTKAESDPENINYGKSCVKPHGYDDALAYLLTDYIYDEQNESALNFLLSGRLNCIPSEELLQETYTSLREGSFRHPSTYNHPRLPRSATRYNRYSRFSHTQRRLQPGELSYADARASMKKLEDGLLAIIGKHISYEFKQDFDRIIEERRRREQLAHARRNQFRHLNADSEIHSYARMIVNVPANEDLAVQETSGQFLQDETQGIDSTATSTHVSAQANPQKSERLELNHAILAYLESNITQSVFDLNSISARLLSLIHTQFESTERQRDAVNIVAAILNTESAHIFGKVLAFLDRAYTDSQEHDQAMTIWVNGFFSESITQHSCNPGALERVVTGLRGLAHPALNRIFSQAEAPLLAINFLKQKFNIFETVNGQTTEKAKKNASNLAIILIEKGVTLQTSSNDIYNFIRDYAQESIAGYGVDLSYYADEIQTISEVLADAYDDTLKAFVEKLLADSEEKLTT